MEFITTSSKVVDFSGLIIVGSIWHRVSPQLNREHNTGLVGFRHFNAEFFPVMSRGESTCVGGLTGQKITLSDVYLCLTLTSSMISNCNLFCLDQLQHLNAILCTGKHKNKQDPFCLMTNVRLRQTSFIV